MCPVPTTLRYFMHIITMFMDYSLILIYLEVLSVQVLVAGTATLPLSPQNPISANSCAPFLEWYEPEEYLHQ